MDKRMLKEHSPYSGAITREQFLFHEMRIVAGLMTDGFTDEEIIEKVQKENLFQYPTEKMLKNLAGVCLKRLHSMENDSLVQAIAEMPSETARQICLYAMMKQYRLIWDFMVTVIGEKYRCQDFRFDRSEVRIFLTRLQEQDDYAATWADSTVDKIRQVILRILADTGYIDSSRTDHINKVMIEPVLERAIREKQEQVLLPVFNCFW